MKPLDRDYFKKKKNPKAEAHKYTECCNQDPDSKILNKNNKEDLEHIESHCENHLIDHSEVETVQPICCKVCGRLVEYSITLNEKSWK